MKGAQVLLLVLVAGAIALFFVLDLDRYLTLEALKAQQRAFDLYYESHPALAVGGFFGAYVLMTALSLPAATIMSLAAGALFGIVGGTIIISFASTIGATIAFVIARYVLRDALRQRYRTKLDAIDQGVAKDGVWFLLTLRLVPLFPFFVANILMALTAIRLWTYFWVSQVGMLPGAIAYANAGTQLARIDNLSEVLSPEVILSFAALGFLPIVAKTTLDRIRMHALYKRWDKPRHFDYNLVVIGAGAAGLVTAWLGAAAKAKVALVEAGRMGGDCLNHGCVPSKALIHSASVARQARAAAGGGGESPQVDFADVMARVRKVIARIAPHDSVERYQALGVDVMRGKAKLLSPWEVEVDGKRVSTRAIVLATGSQPVVPPIPGLHEAGFHTSDTIWEMDELPRRLLVLGGGPVGCELAQAFARLGSQVTQVVRGERILPREDEDVARAVSAAMAEDGVRVLAGHEAVRCERDGSGKRLVTSHGGGETGIPFDVLLCAVGRTARTRGLGLEELEIPLSREGTIATDAWLQTNYPNIYACGDAAGPYQFTHVAAHQAWYAAVNGLFGSFKRFQADYSVIPWCTFTSPEAARVGLSEDEAREQGVEVEVTRYDIGELDRAITDDVARGFVKVLTEKGSDRIAGVAIVAAHAGEMLAEYVLAMKHGIGLKKVLKTIHVYPTMAEANKHVAGEWRRAHAPRLRLRWAGRFHRWRRKPASRERA